jgi:hypothetical protein
MAFTAPQGSRWNVTLEDPSLVVEGEPARTRQAEFSRFRMALGLKKEIELDSKIIEIVAYGCVS